MNVVSRIIALLTMVSLASEASAQALEKIVAVQQAQISSQKASQFGLGSIQQSLLTEPEFQTLMGSGWVAMDGRSIAGSRLAELTKGRLERLPDARGRFLRTAGGAAATVGDVQGQSTSANGLTCLGSVDISHDHGMHHHDLATTGDITSGVLGATSKLSVNAGNVMTYNIAGPGSSAKAAPTQVKLDSTRKDLACSIAGSSETRPDNLTVNTYIKIN